jgi:hypothetical protein
MTQILLIDSSKHLDPLWNFVKSKHAVVKVQSGTIFVIVSSFLYKFNKNILII